MEFEIVELEERILEGVWINTTNENGQSIKDIGTVWQNFFEQGEYEKIKNKLNSKTIGLYTDYEGDYTKPYKFIVGCYVSKKSQDIQNRIIKVIPKGKYAKFVINGDVQKSVGEAWSKIWNMNLDRKYTCDFEEYQNNSSDMQNQEIHIYIALND